MLACLSLGGLAGCGDVERGLESLDALDTASADEALHGLGTNPAPDTAFPAVVRLGLGGTRFCSGTLLPGHYVLTAAHCVAGVANDCETPEGRTFMETRPIEVQLFTDGVTLAHAYRVDAVAAHPDAYPTTLASCPDTATTAPADTLCTATGPDPEHPNVIRPAVLPVAGALDVALLHLRVEDGEPAPETLAAPISVRTAAGSSGWASTLVNGATLTVAGWGVDDDPAFDPTVRPLRLAGPMVADTSQLGQGIPVTTCANAAFAPGGSMRGGHLVMRRPDAGTDPITGAALYGGAYIGSGDSGGPVLLQTTLANGTVLTEVVGVNSGGGGGRDGVVAANTDPAGSLHAPTFRPEVAQWLEQRMRDWDEDGVLNGVDNCMTTPNPEQTNSNGRAENASRLRGERNAYGSLADRLGDVCDPVPVAVATPKYEYQGGTRVSLPLGGYIQQGQNRLEALALQTKGAYPRTSHADATEQVGYTVRNADTAVRFCQKDAKVKGLSCTAPLVLQNDRLAWAGKETHEAKFPFHSVVVRPESQGKTLARGGEWPLDYGEDTDRVDWDYGQDESYWASGLIPSLKTCMGAALFGRSAGSCLDGTFWTHCRSAVGDTVQSVFAGTTGHRVGLNGANLANTYVEVKPISDATSGKAGVFAPLFFFLWKTLPDPAPYFDPSRDLAEVVLGFSPLLGGVVTTADGETWTRLGQEAYTAGVASLFVNPFVQVVTAADLGAETAPVALVVDKLSMKLVDAVVFANGKLALQSEVAPSALKRLALPVRRGAVLAYSAATEQVFVAGRSKSTGARQVASLALARADATWTEVALSDAGTRDFLDLAYSASRDELSVLRTRDADGVKQAEILVARPGGSGVAAARLAWPVEDGVRYWLVPDVTGKLVVTASSETRHVGLRLPVDGLFASLAERIEAADLPLAARPVATGRGLRWPVATSGALSVEERTPTPGDWVEATSALVVGE